MAAPEPAPRIATGGSGAYIGLGIAAAQDPGDPSRTIVTRGENYRHIRHAEVLARWPVIAEDWASGIERARVTRP